MKRRRAKGLEIFSMSALDLFATAMGVFILVAVIALPYYKKEIPDLREKVRALAAELGKKEAEISEMAARLQKQKQETQAAKSAAAQAQDQLQKQNETERQCLSQLRKEKTGLAQCLAVQRQKFILVVMSWSTFDDLDLHITDPAGREYYYKKKSFPGSPAELEVDSIVGPGNEIWLHPNATPGDYLVHYRFFRRRDDKNPKVRGVVLHQEEKHEIPERELRSPGEKPHTATIRVTAEGDITVIFP